MFRKDLNPSAQNHKVSSNELAANKSKMNIFLEKLNLFQRIVSNGIILAFGLLFVFLSYKEFSSNIVLIEPFEVPEFVSTKGYSGRVVANKFIDQIDSVKLLANSYVPTKAFSGAWDKKELNLEIPGSNLTISSIFHYVKSCLGVEPVKISGEIVVKEDDVFVTTRITGHPAMTSSGRMQELDKVLRKNAEYVYKCIQPYVLAAYLLQSDPKNEAMCLELISHILSNNPKDDDCWALMLRGKMYLRRKEHLSAIEMYEEALKMDPDFYIAHLNLGIVFVELRKYSEAIIQYNKCINLNPKYADAYLFAGNVLKSQKKHSEAIAHYNKCIQLNPGDATVYARMGLAFAAMQDYPNAIKTYKKYIQFKPNDRGGYLRLAHVYSAVKDYSNAIAQYRTYTMLNPNDPLGYWMLGAELEKRKLYKEAIQNYQKTCQLDPRGNHCMKYQQRVAELGNKL